eukprot:jgi/Mesen1/7610/ME000397S06673
MRMDAVAIICLLLTVPGFIKCDDVVASSASAEDSVVVGKGEPSIEQVNDALSQWKAYGEKLSRDYNDVASAYEVLRKDQAIVASDKIALESFVKSLQTEVVSLQSEVASSKLKVSELEGVVLEKADVLKGLEKELSSITEGSTGGEKGLHAQLKDALSQAARASALDKQLADAFAEAARLKEQLKAADKYKEDVVKLAAELEVMKAKLLDSEYALSFAKGDASHTWANYGQPALADVRRQAGESSQAALKWAQPHLATVVSATRSVAGSAVQVLKPATDYVREQHKKLSPEVEKQWKAAQRVVHPHFVATQNAAASGIEKARNMAAPHVDKMSRLAEPYLKVVREHTRPYVEKVADVAAPHVARAQKHVAAARQYSEEYHVQLQASVKDALLASGYSKPSASLIWFLALVALLLPFVVVFLISWPLMRGGDSLQKPKPVSSARRRKHHGQAKH